MRGYDIETLTNDVAEVIQQRDLHDVTLVAHSMGSIEAVNYLAQHDGDRIARLVLVAPTTPLLVQTEDNPDGVVPLGSRVTRQIGRLTCSVSWGYSVASEASRSYPHKRRDHRGRGLRQR